MILSSDRITLAIRINGSTIYLPPKKANSFVFKWFVFFPHSYIIIDFLLHLYNLGHGLLGFVGVFANTTLPEKPYFFTLFLAKVLY